MPILPPQKFSAPSAPLTFRFGSRTWTLGNGCRIMGIVNVTPDSFSDGGTCADPQRAVAHALLLAAAGAEILDIGGESTRPGAAAVTEAEELRRVIPVIQALRQRTDTAISIDTCKAAVARAAVAAGANMVNDVTGFRADSGMLEVLRDTAAGAVAMHMRGTPATMATLTDYTDLEAEIAAYFAELLERAAALGIERQRFLLDPGIGFSKTAAQSLQLVQSSPTFHRLGCGVLLGPSRKSFLAPHLPPALPAAERIWGTAAAVTAAVLSGADIVRVHDVKEMQHVVNVANALRKNIQ